MTIREGFCWIQDSQVIYESCIMTIHLYWGIKELKNKKKTILDACYYCTTPYQLITSIILKIANKECADLYIVPQFKNAHQYAERVRDIQLFNRVRVVETKQLEKHKQSHNRMMMHFGIVKQYLGVDEIVKKIVFEKTFYDKMYVSSKAYIGRMVYLYNIKHHINTELIYYDDGEGSY